MLYQHDGMDTFVDRYEEEVESLDSDSAVDRPSWFEQSQMQRNALSTMPNQNITGSSPYRVPHQGLIHENTDLQVDKYHQFADHFRPYRFVCLAISLPLNNYYVKEIYSLDQSNKYLRQSSAVLYSIILFLLTILLPLLLHLIFADDVNDVNTYFHYYYPKRSLSSSTSTLTNSLGTIDYNKHSLMDANNADDVSVQEEIEEAVQNKILLLFYYVDMDRIMGKKLEFLAQVKEELLGQLNAADEHTKRHRKILLHYATIFGVPYTTDKFKKENDNVNSQHAPQLVVNTEKAHEIQNLCKEQGFSVLFIQNENSQDDKDVQYQYQVLSPQQIGEMLKQCHYAVITNHYNYDTTGNVLTKMVQAIRQLILEK
ncbi:hypothetical protein RFI_13601 [Reticulomyxa filosa]|uniref:Uncharacterized protein n=1 Tax=Reticulomyxa filosa TaxID=46433 RepID=X6NCT5_RETFI|nr:hypothetical protein RFI_13601 [Reticulomyxa filosa]|eukprot:ETO23579.1 hypothetical protein RFI_13601 [Reticulomyxa filosa]